MPVTVLRVWRRRCRVWGRGELERVVERLLTRVVVWASICSARTEGEGGRGTVRARARVREGVLGWWVEALGLEVSLLVRERGNGLAIGFFLHCICATRWER